MTAALGAVFPLGARRASAEGGDLQLVRGASAHWAGQQ